MWRWALSRVLGMGLSVILAGVALPGAALDVEPAWQQVRSEAGITSWKRERKALPVYRARATLDASVWDALAVLDDVDHACEWTSHCAEMRRVKTLSERAVVVYARMDAPWPVRDRDVAVHVSVDYGGIGELTVKIRALAVPELPPTSQAVRMPAFTAHYRFLTREDLRTDVEYQLEFDPGGALPDWLKALVAKNLAHDTLDDLRDRVRWAQQRGVYARRVHELAERAHASGYQSVASNAP
ncbi:MAG TPA: START domain-containing protein [Polyangiales bacterium]